MTDDLVARLRDPFTSGDLDLGDLAAAIESLMQRIDGYQASRDWSIDALAKAIGVEADKLRALEYYARLASEKLERAEAESARLMHELQVALAERDALRKDAERYRWLRENVASRPYETRGGREWLPMTEWYISQMRHHKTLDSAIDAAMDATPGTQR